LNIDPKDKISDLYQAGEEKEFEIVSITPAEHRLGLKLAGVVAPAAETKTKKAAVKEEETAAPEEEKPAKKSRAAKKAE